LSFFSSALIIYITITFYYAALRCATLRYAALR
jgi:hypothetical protein